MLGTTMLSITQQLLLSQMGRKLGFALSILLSLLQEQHSQGIITLGGKGPSLPVPSSPQGSEPKASQMRCTGTPLPVCEVILQATEIYCSNGEKIVSADSPPPWRAGRCRASLSIQGRPGSGVDFLSK